MTEVTLKVVPRPRRTVLGIVHFDDLVHAAEATPPLLELKPSAVELDGQGAAGPMPPTA